MTVLSVVLVVIPIALILLVMALSIGSQYDWNAKNKERGTDAGPIWLTPTPVTTNDASCGEVGGAGGDCGGGSGGD